MAKKLCDKLGKIERSQNLHKKVKNKPFCAGFFLDFFRVGQRGQKKPYTTDVSNLTLEYQND